MRRVVVPLDGTGLAEAILPDARRLAGPDGEIILIHDASIVPHHGVTYLEDRRQAVGVSREYLNEVAEKLRGEGAKVNTQTMVMSDAALAIDEAATIFHGDIVAVATHARGALGRLFRGSTAWRALANSPVPVLLRHVHEDHLAPSQPLERRILVPLDGSTLAEKALPLARQLAGEWNAEIWLAHVVFTLATASGGAVLSVAGSVYQDIEPLEREAEAYLREIATTLEGEVHTHVLLGSPVDELVSAADEWGISDIVMASHGRTGLPRVILGSVADALIHRLNLPIIVVPALAAQPTAGSTASAQGTESRTVPL